ncbi:anti-sigma factor family protein [Angustibacter aerolatus]
MIQRVSSHSPCLGERVAALADGSMNPDAATRAVAHVAHCARCREALELERLTIERLRALPDPQPSGDLMASLLSLGGPGGPVPVRHGRVPGTPRQPTTSVAPPGGYPQGWPGPSAPGGSRRPGARRGVGRRAFVTAAAGALGAGAVVVGLAGPLTASTPGTGRVQPPTAQLVPADRFSVDHRFARAATTQRVPSALSPSPSLVSPSSPSLAGSHVASAGFGLRTGP